MKPKLLIVQLWAVGDLAIATPFLRKASEHFEVTLLAKPFAFDYQARFWPSVKVIPFNAPWTAFAFTAKYRLTAWPWRKMVSVWLRLRREKFDVALSARWDPRDHLLLRLTGARTRLGFPRVGSSIFLSHPLPAPDDLDHQYEYWRIIGRMLHLDLPPRDQIDFPPRPGSRVILVHTGAAQQVRVWPLERYHSIIKKLRARGESVRIVCNPDQLAWWRSIGELDAASPVTIRELMEIMDESGVFVGNDSGPGHLAAFCGLPTFTLFGPQVSEWFVPLHPRSELIDGKACPFKPCSDYCRYPVPHCLHNITEAEMWSRLERFIDRNLHQPQKITLGAALA